MKKNRLVGDLYRLLFADGKSYIGASILGAEKRFVGHCRAVTKGATQFLYTAWRKLGQPQLIILERGLDVKKLWVAEKAAILFYKTKAPFGYNYNGGSVRPPGPFGTKRTPEQNARNSLSLRGLLRSDDVKKRMSVAQRERYQVNPVSEETKKKMRIAQRRANLSPDTQEKKRQAQLGKKHTEKTKARCREMNLGRKLSAEQRENNRLAHVGKKHSAEWCKHGSEAQIKWHSENTVSEKTRNKISKSNLGKKRTPEQKERYRLAGIERWRVRKEKEAVRRTGLVRSSFPELG